MVLIGRRGIFLAFAELVLCDSEKMKSLYIHIPFCEQKCFSQVCEELVNYLPENQVSQKSAQFLDHWLEAGLVSEIEY